LRENIQDQRGSNLKFSCQIVDAHAKVPYE